MLNKTFVIQQFAKTLSAPTMKKKSNFYHIFYACPDSLHFVIGATVLGLQYFTGNADKQTEHLL